MSKLYLMTGVSGSGKTTFAKEFARKNNLRCLNIDNFYYATLVRLYKSIDWDKYALIFLGR